jgi:membrane protein YqaA with SNARE-associated domain
MFRQMYDWVMRLAATRHAPKALAVISFAESSFFPIPPDALLGPMVLARRERTYVYATLCAVAAVPKHFGGAMLTEFEKRIDLCSIILLGLLIALILILKVFL